MKISKRFQKTDAKKLHVACRTLGIKLGEAVEFGKDEFMVELDSKDPAKFFEAGQLFNSVTGNEFDAADAKKAAAAKAAEAKKK